VRRSVARLVLVLAAALAAAHAAGASGGTAWSACSLLTRAEASSALGTALKTVTPRSTATGAKTCNWIGAGSGLPLRSITATAATDYGKRRWQARRGLASHPVALKGLGSGAYREADGRDIVAWAGNDFLEISSPSVTPSRLLLLAHRALQRLEQL
jgi:hypothetical protein